MEQVLAALEGLRADIQRVDANVEKIHAKLWIGNGTPAIVTRIDRLETARNQHDAEVKHMAENRDRWTHGIAIAVAVNILSGIALWYWTANRNVIPSDQPPKENAHANAR